jgi:pyrroloquinoline quinone biosynthesis protein D
MNDLLNKVFAISPGFRLQWEKVQNAYVLLYPEGMVKLNGSAGEILAQIDGEKNLQQVIETLQEKFSMAESIADDVIEFIQQAMNNQWVHCD